MVLGTLATASLASTGAFSGDVVRIGDRCAVYGPGFVDLGNGTCGKTSGSRAGGWTNGASNAGLRSDGLGMLPGAGDARHLRIQVSPDFR